MVSRVAAANLNDPNRDIFDGWDRKWRTLWCWSQLYLGFKAAQARGRMLTAKHRQEFWDQKHSYLAEKMWHNIADLRGWWVKVGQFLSTRSDLLPSQYVKHLVKLQDMMPTSEYSVIKAIVEDELGKPIEELFASFEQKAIASASIGQVHKAVLKDGTPVVVKVQHPGVDKLLSQDMVTLTQLSWAFGFLEQGLNFTPILIEWQKAAASELDFRMELSFQQRARNAVIQSGIDIIIPNVYPELTTKRVMVMEFCEGFKITDVEKLKKFNVDTDALMISICESFAHQIHVDGMFNGDPHPGNILVQVDGKTGKARAVLLDWGLVKTFDEAGKIAFAKTVYTVANMDVMGLMAAFEEMGFKFKTDSVIDPELYMDALRVGFFQDTGDTGEDKTESVSDIAKDSGIDRKTVQEKNPIDDWPKDIIFFIRVASLLHGLSLQLNAKIPFLQILVSRAEECLLRRFVPPSPVVYVQYPASPNGFTRSIFEWRVHRFLRDLLERRNLLLGCQVSVVLEHRMIVDTCVGRLGPINTRPVQRNSLFCIMTVCNGLLATALLKLVDTNQVKLDDCVCHYWDGFIRYGKQDITIADVLSHRAGFHRALPRDLTLTQLTDYEKMIGIIENATPSPPMGNEAGRYAYLTSGWIFSEIVRGVTNQRIDAFFKNSFIYKYGLSSEMLYPVSKALLKAAVMSEQQKLQDYSKAQESSARPQPSKPVSQGPGATPAKTDDLTISTEPLRESKSKWIVDNRTAGYGRPAALTYEINFEELFRTQYLGRLGSFKQQQQQEQQQQKQKQQQQEKRRASTSTKPAKQKRRDLTEDKDETEHKHRRHGADKARATEAAAAADGADSATAATSDDSETEGNVKLETAEAAADRPFELICHNLGTSTGPPAPKVISAWLSNATADTHSSRNGAAASSHLIRPVQTTVPSEPAGPGEPSVEPSSVLLGSVRGVDILQRFTSSRREVGIARISNKEVMEKMNAAKKAAANLKASAAAAGGSSDTSNIRYRSKYKHRLFANFQSKEESPRVSAIELGKLKPHVLDPLIYDSRKLHQLLIPPTNCRSTARALARFYGYLASGKILSRPLLEKAAEVRTVDPTLDALFLTGGGSRLWGLGYQVYPCVQIPQPEVPVSRTSNSAAQQRRESVGLVPAAGAGGAGTMRQVSFRESMKTEGPGTVGERADVKQQQSKVIKGIGHGDMSGSVALCFPELKLSIAILVNDVLNGPQASTEILKFILNGFGLEPAWNVPYSIDQAVTDVSRAIQDRSEGATGSAGMIRRSKDFYVSKVIPRQ